MPKFGITVSIIVEAPSEAEVQDKVFVALGVPGVLDINIEDGPEELAEEDEIELEEEAG